MVIISPPKIKRDKSTINMFTGISWWPLSLKRYPLLCSADIYQCNGILKALTLLQLFRFLFIHIQTCLY